MIAFLQTCQTELPAEQTMIDATFNTPVPWKHFYRRARIKVKTHI